MMIHSQDEYTLCFEIANERIIDIHKLMKDLDGMLRQRVVVQLENNEFHDGGLFLNATLFSYEPEDQEKLRADILGVLKSNSISVYADGSGFEEVKKNILRRLSKDISTATQNVVRARALVNEELENLERCQDYADNVEGILGRGE